MIVEGAVLPLDRANIDTDQITPGQFLVGVSSPESLAPIALSGVPGFEALLAGREGAPILVTRENFGCGSSREHAVWALLGRGIRAVVAPSFARIFEENAYNNGLLPAVIAPEAVDGLLRAERLRIDLDAERITLPDGQTVSFTVDALRRAYLEGGGFLPFVAARIDKVRAWEREHLS